MSSQEREPMTEEHRIEWLDNCRDCTKQKPKMANARCELWQAVQNRYGMAIYNIGVFADDRGVCKQFEPKEVK